MSRYILVNKGKSVAIVDDRDWKRLKDFSWSCSGKGSPKTVVRYYGQPYHDSMARMIMDAPLGIVVDHISGDVLDNRRSNLRLATCAENTYNRAMHKNKVLSKYKGVARMKNCVRWRARITKDGKTIHLGLFKTEEEAAYAYNNAANVYFGEFARLNVIDYYPQDDDPSMKSVPAKKLMSIPVDSGK